MKLEYTESALRALSDVPLPIRKAFIKQAALLLLNLHYPSLRAKKYSESADRWQARVTSSWRFYFKIVGDRYIITDIIPHPK